MESESEFSPADNPAIRKLVNMIILLMIRDEQNEFSIRPVNGQLQVLMEFSEMVAPPVEVLALIVARLKILAELDVFQTEEVQSGRVEFTVEPQGVVRLLVTTIPSDEGEGVLVTREG